MKNSNEHLEKIRAAWKEIEYDNKIEMSEEEIVDWFLSKFASHHAHLKERVMSMKKEPEIVLTRRDKEDSAGTFMNYGYNDALNDVLKLLE